MKLKFIPIFVGALSLMTCWTDAIALSATPNSVVAQESTSRPTPPPPGLLGISPCAIAPKQKGKHRGISPIQEDSVETFA